MSLDKNRKILNFIWRQLVHLAQRMPHLWANINMPDLYGKRYYSDCLKITSIMTVETQIRGSA